MLECNEIELSRFGEYLLRNNLMPEHRAKYCVIWVRRFLKAPVDTAMSFDERLAGFCKNLASQGCQDWQIEQAERSVRITGLLRYYADSVFPPYSLLGGTSLLHAPVLPTVPSPHTLGTRLSLLHATPQLSRLPDFSGPGFVSPPQTHRVSGRIAFVILRASRSPPDAPHPALPPRSFVQFRAGERMPGADFHRSVQVRLQAHGGPPAPVAAELIHTS